ncbi:UDP-glucuronosyltransferase 1-8-like isoform X1 [Bombus vosnesenskii]|uniref:UDP-glucuronosyltransferase 1-8-like isoform X1 n=1 Tax=Bombus vosnesenskii TaxID=207650 RepID=A0A6J3JXZ0_9HYME|nr:UDP-glucuronosyltransferase 1-8-like isoform X1 [Bombus vosnesenskii]
MRLLLPIFLTILACGWCSGLRILGMFPLNGKSHWVMAERLMTSLAERGHQVDVVTHFPMKNPPPNYNQISLEGSLPAVVNSMHNENITRFGRMNVKNLVKVAGNSVCELLAHKELQDILKRSKDRYDLVITELFAAPCYLAFGRHLNKPVIGIVTSAFHEWLSTLTGNPNNPSFMPGLFSSFGQRMTFWERLHNTFLTNLISWQMNYYLDEQGVYVKKFFNIDASIPELYQDIAAILVNSHHSINGVRPMTTGVIEVGGLHINENSDPLTPELKKWLDESTHGCIFFTFGSMVRIETFPKPLLETFYKVFERIAPVRVLMKVAQKKDLLPGLPKNVMIQSWFPQTTVFKHKNVKAFITHGGLMGTLEAIYFGIPMIGIPLFGDQITNMRNAANKNIAVNLGSAENITEENLYSAIDTILHDETYRSSMQTVSKIFKDRPMSAIDTAVYWVEYVARNGFALQSPAIHLNWWQQNLIDVYGFLLVCLLVVLYVTVLLVKKLKNCIFGCKPCIEKQTSESKKKK